MPHSLNKLLKTKAENINTASRVEFSFFSSDIDFPLIIKPRLSGLILSEWLKSNRILVNERLSIHGAILLRGFDIDTVEKFQDFINTLDPTPIEYKQRSSPRFEVAKNIYHSTTYPSDQSIHMHSENSYAMDWPMKIVFCCIQPAREQGETPIADTRRVVKYLCDETRDKFMTKGIRYVRNISKNIGLSWGEVFQTKDKDAVEKECDRTGISFEWKNDDDLVLSWVKKAIYNHPITGEEVWFSHASFFNKYSLGQEVLSTFNSDNDLPFNTYFGDGSVISKSEVDEIIRAYENASYVFPWEKGDVMILDNMMMAHGRSPYKGDRQIIVSMFN